MGLDQYILLVEDDLDISEAIQSILEEEKYKVKCTFNGKEALDYLTTAEKTPSLILLDIMMPQMNGYEFREAQLQDPRIANIPTIILSAAGKYENIEKLNFKECLKKPLDLETLIDVVKKNIS
ncbi:MAG: response regulator [Bacteriovorax sp.]|nr:response regulator [Bacteriovorax sp.]